MAKSLDTSWAQRKVAHWRWLKTKEKECKRSIEGQRQILRSSENELEHIQGLIAILDDIVCKKCAGTGRINWTISHDMDDVEHGSDPCRDCKGNGFNEIALGDTGSNGKQ